MTWKSLVVDLYRAGSWLTSFVYPPTKRKLHRVLHTALTAMAVLLAVAVWFTEHSASAKVVTDLLVTATYLARWQVVVGRLDRVVDRLPIPEGDSELGQAVRAAAPAGHDEPPKAA